jgi:dTDP-4-dehydrorhamnose 3,5-epimerase
MSNFERKYTRSSVLPDILEVSHSKFLDHRGSLWTTYDDDAAFYTSENIPLNFNHDKFARNEKNVLRGIHGDMKSWKLVTSVFGKFFQVVVDCREESKTYLKHISVILDAENPRSILLPPGFGNAFLALTEGSVYHYKLSYTGEYNDAEKQFTYRWNDPRIKIDWPIQNPILSERDMR